MMLVLQLIKRNMIFVLLVGFLAFSGTLFGYYNPFLKDHTGGPQLVVLITSHNNEKFFYRNLDSIVKQKLDIPFKVVYVNDCSTDKTAQLVESYIRVHNLESMFTVIHNKTRVGALANQYHAIHTLPDQALVVQMDGDDFLAHDRALERIVKEHRDKNIWISYSQMMYYPEGPNAGWLSAEYPQYVLDNNSFREYRWVTYQVKTFYAGLFKRIKKEDLMYEGDFFPRTGDFAFMYPMLEMASRGHIAYIPDVLYIYNHHNPISDHNTNRTLQIYLGGVILAMPKYDPIEEN